MSSFRTAPDLEGMTGLPGGAVTLWAPADVTNFSTAGAAYGGAIRRQVAICYHTPEEPWDDNEITPAWFKDPRANASTGYYADSDGDLWQMVRDADFAWAQGTRTRHNPNTVMPRPDWWRGEYISYNTCMLSIEIEGYARDIGQTFTVGSPQFNAVVAWSAFQCLKYGIPVNRQHHLGHSELCTTKGDPGAAFPWRELMMHVDDRVKLLSAESDFAERSSAAADVMAGRIDALTDQVAVLAAAVADHDERIADLEPLATHTHKSSDPLVE